MISFNIYNGKKIKETKNLQIVGLNGHLCHIRRTV